ncbi:hypothetical protein ACPCUV_37415 [Streptomyces platensis]|uniref:hypothetical protein n=1 Tax=Streptomyces platensis TaxID=58346 RepID=UPI003C2D2FA6
MEWLALPPLRSADPARGELVLIDELGRMELACTAFQDVVPSGPGPRGQQGLGAQGLVGGQTLVGVSGQARCTVSTGGRRWRG